MARCIGQAGCDRDPTAGRGLCRTCYLRHHHRGTLRNFPTMRERAEQLAKQPVMRALVERVEIRRRNSNANSIRRYRERQYAQRVEIDGVLVHPHARHGYLTSYNVFGCRGAMCLASQRHYRRTGESSIPEARERDYSPEDCLDYKSDEL